VKTLAEAVRGATDHLLRLKDGKAKETKLTNNFMYKSSYIVYECPMFIDDTVKYNKRLKVDITGNRIVREVINRRTPEEALTTNKSDARKRLESIPETDMRRMIDENLMGIDKDVAKLAFIGRLTAEQIGDVVFLSSGAIKKRMRKIINALTNSTV
jgi:hypothetical protein